MIIPSKTLCQSEQTKQLGLHVLIIGISIIHKCGILSPVINHTSLTLAEHDRKPFARHLTLHPTLKMRCRCDQSTSPFEANQCFEHRAQSYNVSFSSSCEGKKTRINPEHFYVLACKRSNFLFFLMCCLLLGTKHWQLQSNL